MKLPVQHNAKGVSQVELACGLMFIIPIVLICFDVGTLIIGVSLNNTVCRDAARAASTGAPNAVDPGRPRARAEAVVKRVCKTEGAVRLRPQVEFSEQVRPPLPKPPFGGPVDGEVTITTTVDIYPPFLVSAVVGKGGMPFSTTQTFPYTWVMPSSITTSPGAAASGP